MVTKIFGYHNSKNTKQGKHSDVVWIKPGALRHSIVVKVRILFTLRFC